MNEKIKIVFLFLFFLSGKFLSQITTFSMAVTTVTQSCEANGKINFNISGTQSGASFDFAIYRSTDLVNPIRVTTGIAATGATLAHTESTLQDGTYFVKATQNFGAQSNQQTQNNVVITDTTTPVAFTLSQTTLCTNYNLTATVTSGTAVSFTLYDTANNIVRPAQASNTFSNVPAGNYVVVAKNACGDSFPLGYTVVTDPSVYSVIRTNYGTQGFNEMYNCNFIEHYDKIEYNGYINIPVSKFPMTVVITIQNPITGVPTVINQTWTSAADNGTQQVLIPYYEGYTYNYNVKIYDACSSTTPVVNKDDTVNASFYYYVGVADATCGSKFFSITDFLREYGNVNVTFTSYPAGFDPATYNSNFTAGTYTHTFTGPIDTAIPFGGVTQAVPPGNYSVLIESCGRTLSRNFTITNNFSDVLSEVGAFSACEDGMGTAAFYIRTVLNGNQVDNLASMQIISAPAAFVSQYGALPYNVSANIASDGRFYMNSLPLGTYTFRGTGANCGVPLDKTITLQENRVYTSNLSLNCGSFNFSVSLSSYLGNESLYLQKYFPASGKWGRPSDGALQNAGDIINYTNALDLGGEWGNPGYRTISAALSNIVNSGNFRVVVRSGLYGNGVPNNGNPTNINSGFTYCERVLETFYVPSNGMILKDYFVIPCASGKLELVMNVIGAATLTYKIISYNGSALLIDNGTSHIFSQLSPGLYEVQVTDGCNATRVFKIFVNAPKLPVIRPENLCNGQVGKLSIDGLSNATIEWRKQGNTTILATGNTLTFNTFNSATHPGTYTATITYSTIPGACINTTLLNYVIPNTASIPEAGTGQTVNIASQNNTTILNLFNYVTGPYDNYGTWTDLSNTGKLVGSLLTSSELAAGTYQFQYSVNGTCSGTDTTVVTVKILAATPFTCDGKLYAVSG